MSAPGWLVAEVAEGLQRLIVLRLDGAPPADAIEGAVLAWVDALMVRCPVWHAKQDAQRVRDAFRWLAAHAVRWPAPAQLWECLPARAQPRMLPPPPMSEEQRAKLRAMLAGMRDKLRGVQ